MEQLQLHQKYAYCREVKDLKDANGDPTNNEPMLRVYRVHSGCLDLQVRTFAPTTQFGEGVKRNMIAGVSLDVEEAKTLRAKIDEFIAEMEG